MNFLEILVIAIGLSMDAFAVSICKGLSVRKIEWKHVALVALWFGSFQAIMPVIGYYLGVGFTEVVSTVDHWIAFVLLSFIGGNMVKESFSKEPVSGNADFSFKTMFAMAVATSIDALAVGVSFAFLRANIWISVAVIGVITAVFSSVGIFIGNAFGSRYKSRAEFAGGVILIIMGLKILVQHLFI